jgi:hypothetical protein
MVKRKSYPKNRKSRKYWENVNNVIAESKEVMEKHGFNRLPTTNELRDLGYSSLAFAIYTYQGGYKKFRLKLGQEKMLGRWMDKDYLIEQARKLMKEMGLTKFPNENELRKIGGYSGMCKAIRRQGGFEKFREELGEISTRVKRGSWKNIDYIISESLRAVKEIGTDELPSRDVLKRFGYGNLAEAIRRYAGGFPEFRKQLSQYLGRPSSGQQLEGVLEHYLGNIKGGKNEN